MTSSPTFVRVRVGDDAPPVSPIPRRIVFGNRSYRLPQAVSLPGGLIVGEGDVGKSTYVRMLAAVAERRGPVLVVPLGLRNHDFAAPRSEAGRVTTLILDGLDEWPECVHEIVERFAMCDQDQLHVWVTSRPGSAADCLRKCGVFRNVYSLAPFTHLDVVKLVDAVGCDGKTFLAAALKHHCHSFLSKPGGVIALLELYSDEGLSGLGAVTMMEQLARKLVAESRNGVTLGPDVADCDVDELYAAAEWIAACTVLTGRTAVWMGPERRLQSGDLPFAALKAGRPNRLELQRALDSRLFEPLATARLRVAYADMPAFLAGSWAAKHMPDDELRRMAVGQDDSPVWYLHPALVWACRLKRPLADEYIGGAPTQFFRCEELVRDYGFDRFVEALRRRFLRLRASSHGLLVEGIVVSGLCPFEDFADWLQADIARKSGGAMRLLAEATLLAGCTTDYARAARSILEAFDRPDIRPIGTSLALAFNEAFGRLRVMRAFDGSCCIMQNCEVTCRLKDLLHGLLERYRQDSPCAGRQVARLVELIDFDGLSPGADDLAKYLDLRSMTARAGDRPRVSLMFWSELFDCTNWANDPDADDDGEESPWTVEDLAAFAESCLPDASALLAEMNDLVNHAVAAAMRKRGGRPPKAGGGLSQRVVAEMFCLSLDKERAVTAEMVANWEAYAKKGVKRGSKPPFGEYDGETIVYTAELRKKPTPENLLRLGAIIRQFKSSWTAKDNVINRKTIHCRSEETQFQAKNGLQDELAKRRSG